MDLDFSANTMRHYGIDMTDIEFGFALNFNSDNLKKQLNSSKDPLALSWACYRQTQDHREQTVFSDLTNVEPIPYDFEMANLSRTFYRDRIIFKKLKGIKISKFSQDLYQLLSSNSVNNNNIGMLYRIPYFYQEDMARKDLQNFYQPIRPHNRKIPGFRDLSLQCHSEIHKFRKSNNEIEFWFYDSLKQPYMFSVAKANPLLLLFQSLCRSQQLNIQAWVFCKSKNHSIDFDYYQLTKIEIR